MNLKDAAKYSSIRYWKLTGKNRIVKVMSPSARNWAFRDETKPKAAQGYVTQEKYLYGKTASQIERLLGLRPGELAQMCHVYSFARLPAASDVEFQLSCAFPDGKVFDAAQADEIMQARSAFLDGGNLYDRSMVPVAQYYPPGAHMVPQWSLLKPVEILSKIATVTDVFPFPRENGSINPYRPHNRGEIR